MNILTTTPATTTSAVAETLSPAALRRVLLAASLGTLFEWYDFYLYGSLAVFFGGLFFPHGQRHGAAAREPGHLRRRLRRPAARARWSSATSAISSAASTPSSSPWRPWGSPPRSSACCRPTRRSASPPRSCWSRCGSCKGLALGGEYGGAATYVAEHVPRRKRGYYTSYIQTTATLGFFLSMGVIGTTRVVLGEGGLQELRLAASPFLCLVRPARRFALHSAEDAGDLRSSAGSRAPDKTRRIRSRRASPTL